MKFTKLYQFNKPCIDDRPRPEYWIMCQYDIVSAGFYVRFSMESQRVKTLYLTSDFPTEELCLDWAVENLHYNALQSFREYFIESHALS